MTLKTGFAMCAGLAVGMIFASRLQTIAHARQITALQVNSCAKADQAGIR
jgi:hypothetical protein